MNECIQSVRKYVIEKAKTYIEEMVLCQDLVQNKMRGSAS